MFAWPLNNACIRLLNGFSTDLFVNYLIFFLMERNMKHSPTTTYRFLTIKGKCMNFYRFELSRSGCVLHTRTDTHEGNILRTFEL